jgi:hypothetical protein
MSAMTDRPDLDSFGLTGLYRHDDTDHVFEFLGAARVPELGDERVGVFESIDHRGELILATRAGYDHGERFTPVGDAMADDIDIARGGR